MTSRVISFGGSSVRLDWKGDHAARIVDFLYRDLPLSEGPLPHIALRMETDRPDGFLTLHCGDELYYHGTSEGALARALGERTLYHLSDKSTGGLLFHAAAVRRGDRCLLLPGRSGSGKTTVAGWLMQRGFEYLTDELVYIPTGSRDVVPFPRPLNVKAVVQPMDRQEASDGTNSEERLEGPGISIVRPAVPHRARHPLTCTLARIVFPRYQPNASFAPEPLTEAQAGLRLMGCLINARNLPGHGFADVARLARLALAHDAPYGDVSQVGEWMRQLPV